MAGLPLCPHRLLVSVDLTFGLFFRVEDHIARRHALERGGSCDEGFTVGSVSNKCCLRFGSCPTMPSRFCHGMLQTKALCNGERNERTARSLVLSFD